MFFFFFFQAEDGIRDLTVTGVQTCALPISGWGIIKGHYYTGGAFALMFTPDGQQIYAAGMGSTTDPAAGNGRQLWQRFARTEKTARKISETKDGDSGAGLMEALCRQSSRDS